MMLPAPWQPLAARHGVTLAPGFIGQALCNKPKLQQAAG